MFRIRFWPVPAILAVLLTLLTGRLTAQPTPTHELGRDDRWSTHIQPPPQWEHAPPPAAQPAAPAADTQRPDPATTRLIFAQYYAGNYDLISADGDGNNLRPLTATPGNEIMPAFNRGANRIAYVSDAGGLPNLYVANADGSNARRLTNVGAREYAYWPQWSPDGRQIVYYHGGRDVRSDIWVVDADGNNRRRLTNEGQWNGDPAWAPDGRIVYVSQRGGAYRIWRMDADGGNKVQLNNTPSSFTPFVSPDGRTLSYVADRDQNLWQEVYSQPYDGQPQPPTPIINSRFLIRYELRGFSPDQRFLQLTELSFVAVSGQGFFLDDTRIYWHKLFTDHLGDATILNLRRAGDASLGLTDLTPPRATFTSLPTDVPAGGSSAVAWDVTDIGGGAVAHIDVEYRRGNGAWQPLPPDNPEFPRAMLHNLAIGAHSVRIRARDNVLNQSDWFSPPAATFSVHGARVQGGITDVRGAALPAGLPTAGSPPFASSSADEGVYDLRLGSDAAPTLRVTRAGYGSQPPATIALLNNYARHSFVLRPANDVITGGQFETAARAGDAHSGNGALRVGPDDMAFVGYDRINVPVDAAAYGSDGRLYLAERNGNDVVLHTLDDGAALPPQTIYTAPHALWGIWLVETSAGVLTLITFDAQHQLAIVRRAPGGDWGTPTFVPLTSDDSSFELKYAIDAQGGVFVAWVRDQGFNGSSRPQPMLLYINASGAPSPVQGVPPAQLPSDTGNGALYLHVLPDGRAYALRGHLLRTGTRGGAQTWVYLRAADDRYPLNARGLGLLVNRHGTVAVYAGLGDVALVDLATGLVHTETNSPLTGVLHAVFLDAHGIVHWVYAAQSTPTPGAQPLYHLSLKPGGWRSAPTLVTANGSNYPGVAVYFGGPLDTPWLLTAPYTPGEPFGPFEARIWQGDRWGAPAAGALTWRDGEELGWLRFNPAGQPAFVQRAAGMSYETLQRAAQSADAVGLTQTVTLPTDGAPTLSLFYRLGAPVAAGGGLRVTLTPAGGAPTTLLRGSQLGGWQHAWADLSPWAGQTVTLNVAQQLVAGQPFGVLHVDELSVGSAYADLRATLSVPSDLLPGDSGPALATWRNAGAVAAPDVTLTLDLPAGLSLLAADPPPTPGTLTWSLGALAAYDAGGQIALTLGVTAGTPLGSVLRPAVVVATAAGEAETANNRAEALLNVRARIYLPLLLRE